MRFVTRIIAAIRGSLKLKLGLIIVGILALTVGIAPWSAIKMQERQLLRGSEQRLRALHAMLRSTIVPTCMLTGDRNAIQAVIEATSRRDEIHAVRLFDAQGTILYSANPAERGARLGPTELSSYYGQATPLVRSGEGHGVDHVLVEPILNQPACGSCHPSEQKVLGVLQVSLTIDKIWAELASLYRFAAVATVLTLGVIGIAIWMALTYLVDHPLQALIGVMGRVADGDLSARTRLSKSDEFGRLAAHLNDMIHKQEVAHQELERYHQERMRRADRLATIGEMAAAIAHEIRNPLTGIRGTLSLLSRGLQDDDPRRAIVRETDLVIDRLDNSVEDILKYSRPPRLQLETIDVTEIVTRVVSLLEGEARRAHVRIRTVPPLGVVPEARIPGVYVDPQQIQQVLVNLVLNAIQATAAGGEVCITTSVQEEPGTDTHVVVDVEDTGKGMTPEEVDKAFEPFFSTKPHGTGLGLAIVRQILARHEGTVSLHSTIGEGTRVRVELPAHRVPAPSKEKGRA